MPTVRHAPKCLECHGDTYVETVRPIEVELHGTVLPTHSRTRRCNACGARVETVELYLRDVYPVRFQELAHAPA